VDVDVVVCGAQMPFMRGGAEQHQENLVTALRDRGHRADLVRLPVSWDKARLFDGPVAWRTVSIDADVVVATNFPSYFVRHPRKVVWLFHQHRAAYDAVDAAWSDFGLDDQALEEQRMLVEWDNLALGEAAALFTTSQVVAARLARFNGLTGSPLYHPPPLAERLRDGAFGDYALSVGRLEANKRPGALLEAVPLLGAGLRAVIAGEGTLVHEVTARARALGVADRVDLPGFVGEDELIELYAGALAVVYAPVDEDYGYVTLQAFTAGKPVITATDSGGVLEWVQDGVTGFVTDGSPGAVAEALNTLAADRELARRMGDAGRRRVRQLDWGQVVDSLLAPARG
jgi:glycosyltransferase involved in cell wall biosynthesis